MRELRRLSSAVAAIVSLILAQLSACGGGSGNGMESPPPPPPNQQPPPPATALTGAEGFWSGTALYRCDRWPVATLITQEGWMFFVPPGGGLFVGLLTPGQPGGLTAVNYRGSGGATPVLDAQPETGAISISDIRTGRGLRLTWPVQDPSFCSENYSILQYDALYERTASLASISGVYSDGDLTIAVNSDGTLTGSDVNSCVFNGSVVVAHANRNYYAATIDVDNCPGSGRFEGIAFLDDSEDLLANHVLRVIVANPEHALWLWLER